MSALITLDSLLLCSLEIGRETGVGDMSQVIGALRARDYDETLDVNGQEIGNSYLGLCYSRITYYATECLLHAERTGQDSLASEIRSYLVILQTRPLTFFTRKCQSLLSSISVLAASTGLADIAETILGVAISDNDLATISYVNQCMFR
jgi:hypothetical protein